MPDPTIPNQPIGTSRQRVWRRHPRESAAILLLGLVGMVVAAASVGASSNPYPAEPELAPSKPVPGAVRNVPPETALALNAQIPVAEGPNPPASPFRLAGASAEARRRALECLTTAIYYEAAREPLDGQRAVAQVVLNRVRHPAFPDSVCGVVFEGSTRVTGCQFTFTCDGSIGRGPEAALWARARQVASAALAGHVHAPVGHATHYHANYVLPYWASSLAKAGVEGAHIFYRWQGGWGVPAAFAQRWSGIEGDPARLRLAALSTPRTAEPASPAAPQATATLDQLEAGGAKVRAGKDGRVRLLFTAEAREIVQKIQPTAYVDRVAASDNLRFALGGNGSAAVEPAFGRKAGPAVADKQKDSNSGGSDGALQ